MSYQNNLYKSPYINRNIYNYNEIQSYDQLSYYNITPEINSNMNYNNNINEKKRKPSNLKPIKIRDRSNSEPDMINNLSIPMDNQKTSKTVIPLGSDSIQKDSLHTSYPPFINKYFWAQIGNASKISLWWMIFGLVTYIIYKESPIYIILMRCTYNLILILISPISGASINRVSTRKILAYSNILRCILYIIIGFCWIICKTTWIIHHQSYEWQNSLFIFFFFICIIIDGIIISFTNLFDIDSGGLDILVDEYNIHISDQTRKKFILLHERCFDFSMIILPCLLGICGYFLPKILNIDQSSIIILSFLCFFILLSLFSLFHYNWHIPQSLIVEKNNQSQQVILTREDIKMSYQFVKEGASYYWNNSLIFNRINCLAIEVGFEDVLINLILVLHAFKIDNNVSISLKCLTFCMIISCGKFGAIISSLVMRNIWKKCGINCVYRIVSYFTFLNGFVLLLLPLTYYINDLKLKYIVTLIGVFVYYFCLSACKVPYATIIQNVINYYDVDGTTFAFIAMYLNFVGIILLIITAILIYYISFEVVLWILMGIITINGTIKSYLTSRLTS